VFDIDGTLAGVSHRLHYIEKKPKKWREFAAASADDKAIDHVCDLACHLSKVKPVVFVSGRSDEVRQESEDWLERETGLRGPLYMRQRHDKRPDYIVKAELLDRLQADGYAPSWHSTIATKSSRCGDRRAFPARRSQKEISSTRGRRIVAGGQWRF
jgi:hypothetical protein